MKKTEAPKVDPKRTANYDTPSRQELDYAGKLVGGFAELGRKIGVTRQCIDQWRKRDKVPMQYCVAIEKATFGRVSAYALCNSEMAATATEFVSTFYYLEPKIRTKAAVRA